MARIPFNVSAKTARLIGRKNYLNLKGDLIEQTKNPTMRMQKNVWCIMKTPQIDYLSLIMEQE